MGRKTTGMWGGRGGGWWDPFPVTQGGLSGPPDDADPTQGGMISREFSRRMSSCENGGVVSE